MTRRGTHGLAAVLAVLAAGPASAAGDLVPGEVIDRVICRDDARQSYALYLPSDYTPERSWPILYALDPRAASPVPAASSRLRGTLPVDLFRPAAERYGWIVVGSHNSLSDADDAMQRNVDALGAMWRDTHARLAIDDRRVYATGMSGGARAACFIADAAPGSIAGVIASAAGFSSAKAPHADLGFLVFGVAGTTDFNYAEMQQLGETLEELHLPHRIATFEGGHSWPPEPLATEAVEWLEIWAIQQGDRERDPAVVESLYAAASERAAALEQAGWLIEAAEAWRDTARGFTGVRDVSEAEAAWMRLNASKAVEKARKARSESLREERAAVQRAAQSFGRVSGKEPEKSLKRLLRDLGIEGLKKQEVSEEREVRLAAQRLLSTFFTQLTTYLPNELKQRKDYARAIISARAAAAVRPERGWPWVVRAQSEALAGDADAALTSLERGIELALAGTASLDPPTRKSTLAHFKAQLEGDDELQAVRERPEFQTLLGHLTTESAPPSS